MLLQQVFDRFLNQFVEPTVFIHGKVGEVPHQRLIEP